MKVKELRALLIPFKQVANPRALTPDFRVIELGDTVARASCGWAYIETPLKLLSDANPVYVDGESFIAVVDSLDPDAEFSAETTATTFEWKAASARGKIALVSDVTVPKIVRRFKTDAWSPPRALEDVLELGSLSAGSNALGTLGLFGVVLDNRGEFAVRSTDSATVSTSRLKGVSKLQMPQMITMSPDSINLLATALAVTVKDAKLEFDEQSVFFRSPELRVILQPVPPLKYDIRDIDDAYLSDDVKIPLPRERVQAFIKRATALAETKRKTTVEFGVEKGRITLAFSEGTASSDEYYLIENLDIPDLAPVSIDAAKLAKALSFTNEIILDSMDKRVLVLRGKDPEFRYIISGRSA